MFWQWLQGAHMETWVAILIGACGTWIIAIIAIGDRLIGPRLHVLKGEFSGSMAQHPDAAHSARYYVVPVSNSRRSFRTAHEVHIVLTRIEKSTEQGRQIIFDEIMPLSWVRQELYGPLTRTIGPDQKAALFFVEQDGLLALTPALGPNGELATHFPRENRGPTTLWLTLQAVSNEADSPPICLKIAWNGEWRNDKVGLEHVCNVSLAP
jgi:hypothetical protein